MLRRRRQSGKCLGNYCAARMGRTLRIGIKEDRLDNSLQTLSGRSAPRFYLSLGASARKNLQGVWKKRGTWKRLRPKNLRKASTGAKDSGKTVRKEKREFPKNVRINRTES